MSRYHMAIEALKHVSRLRSKSSDTIDMFTRKLFEHSEYIRQHLEDMPEIRDWYWTPDFSEPDAPPPLAKGHPRAGLFTDS
jgi:xylulose-5-phosphate/fructose-6-phosphate phosphoketolase